MNLQPATTALAVLVSMERSVRTVSVSICVTNKVIFLVKKVDILEYLCSWQHITYL